MSRFDLTAAVAGEVGATPALTVGPVKASLGPLELRSGDTPVATLARAELDNARLALADKRLDIDALTLSGVADPGDAGKGQDPELGAHPAKSSRVRRLRRNRPRKPALEVALARFALDGVDVGFTDQTAIRPVRLDLVDGFVKLSDLSLDLTRPLPLEAGFAVKQGGRFDASGTLAPAPLKGDLKLKLAGLSLKPFAPYLNTIVRLNLNRGTANTSGRLKLAAAAGKPLSLAFDGGFSVDQLDITEEESGASYLGWERLASKDLQVGLAPNRVHMAMLRADRPVRENPHPRRRHPQYSEADAQSACPAGAVQRRMTKRRTPPRRRQMRRADEARPCPSARRRRAGARRNPAGAAKPQHRAAFPVMVEQVRIDNGKLDFTDLSLTPKFGTLMHTLSGVINGLSTNPDTAGATGAGRQGGRVRLGAHPRHAAAVQADRVHRYQTQFP